MLNNKISDQSSQVSLKQVVWDYDLNEVDFMEILNGKKTIGWFNRVWAITRIIENLHFYDVIKLVSQDVLLEFWSDVKEKLFDQKLKDDYEWFLQRYTLSSAR